MGSVEENITRVLGDESPFCAVNVPDDKKGEAIALLIKTEQSPAEIMEALKQSDLIPLMLPTHILPVETLPMLASGKADFKGAKKMAVEILAGENKTE